MSFMDDMRRAHQDAKSQESADSIERRRLVAISQQIIRDEIGLNYHKVLLKGIKKSAKANFVKNGKIEVLHFRNEIRLSWDTTECDVDTIVAYLEKELDIAFSKFDAEVDGKWRHKAVYNGTGRAEFQKRPALQKSVIPHHYVADDINTNSNAQPYWFDVGVIASYHPPLT